MNEDDSPSNHSTIQAFPHIQSTTSLVDDANDEQLRQLPVHPKGNTNAGIDEIRQFRGNKYFKYTHVCICTLFSICFKISTTDSSDASGNNYIVFAFPVRFVLVWF